MKSGEVTVADATALQQCLEQNGKIALYGTYFDTAKSEVKPESSAELEQMAKRLNNKTQLRVYIVGHTDNQGTLAGNLELSQHRADAVANTLIGTYHVDAKRLSAKGVGSLAPVASNTADEGRALNRRVELVMQ